MTEEIKQNLPNKVLLSRGDVMRATGWTRYYIEQLEEEKILMPIRWNKKSHRRYTRVSVLKIVENMEVPREA